MAPQGGLDSGLYDAIDGNEEQIRAEVRHCCEEYASKGHFIPSITYGGPGTFYPERYEIINDEIEKYNMKHYGIA